MKLLRCLLARTHSYSWPQNGVQTCVYCGRQRKALVEITVDPRLNIPRWKPRATPADNKRLRRVK